MTIKVFMIWNFTPVFNNFIQKSILNYQVNYLTKLCLLAANQRYTTMFDV